MSKVERFLSDVNRVLKVNTTNGIKRSIKDSVNNNRVITVNQLIRFLKKKDSNLALKVSVAYGFVKHDIKFDRVFYTRRTDAVDINEFLRMCTVMLPHSRIANEIFNRI